MIVFYWVTICCAVEQKQDHLLHYFFVLETLSFESSSRPLQQDLFSRIASYSQLVVNSSHELWAASEGAALHRDADKVSQS